ncbi:MAG: dihydrolipoamide acetyltransferase family protein, partial [Chloroflexota bacterium]
MPEQVIMPRLSDTMTEGTVSKWLKRPGDAVNKGEPLVEIETDKANIELEAYASGTLARIVLPEGQSAPVGDVIGEIALTGEKFGASPAAPAAPAQSEVAPVQPAVAHSQAAAAPAGQPPTAKPAAVTPAREGALRASPMARRVARELGVQLQAVQGSGPLGRIRKDDVTAAASAAPPAPTGTDGGTEAEVVPLSRMQQTIARRMVESKTTIPHFYVSMEVDMQAALATLDGLNDGLEREQKVTINDLILKACAVSLRAFPAVNSFYADGHLIQNSHVHVGFAVAVPNGLLVPVVRDVDLKNVREVALATKALVKKTRDGKLEPADYEGGTFSVSNLGMYGVDE